MPIDTPHPSNQSPIAHCVCYIRNASPMMQSRGSSPSHTCRDACIRLQVLMSNVSETSQNLRMEQRCSAQLNRMKQRTAHHCHLDLGHGRTFPDTTSGAHSGTARAQASDDQRCGESCEHEPEECGRGLEFLAALGHVVRSVCQVVVDEVGLLTM